MLKIRKSRQISLKDGLPSSISLSLQLAAMCEFVGAFFGFHCPFKQDKREAHEIRARTPSVWAAVVLNGTERACLNTRRLLRSWQEF